MSSEDKIATFLSKFGNTLASVVKIVLKSKRITSFPTVASSEQLVILGNGPSLNGTIENDSWFLKGKRLAAVNFACNSEVFFELKPDYYVLADPLFFTGLNHDNVATLWNNLERRVNWNLTLFVPATYSEKSEWFQQVKRNCNITVYRYNLTPVEGFDWIENAAFKSGLGMPRPRNVLIPTIMIALRMKYKHIFIAGADHSWTKTLSVSDDNRVVSVQPHFYKESEKEEKRQSSEYQNYPLYKIMYSFYVAFRSYFTIRRFAEHIGTEIINITPGSFIDAFKRLDLSRQNDTNK